MESVDILSSKIAQTAQLLKKLSDENVRLKAEVDFLRKESLSNASKLAQYVLLKENAARAAVKIERVLKKIDTLS